MAGAGISDEKKLYVAEMLEKGCTYKQISQDLGVSNQVIANIKREFYGADKMKRSIVAGDKFNGLLQANGNNQFVGTCRVKGGKFEKKRFMAYSRQEAAKLYNEWKEELMAENQPVIDNPPITVTPVRAQNIQTPKEEPKESTGAVYILAFGNPKLASYFTDLNEAVKVAELLNYGLRCADVETRGLKYNVIGVEPYTLMHEAE